MLQSVKVPEIKALPFFAGETSIYYLRQYKDREKTIFDSHD